MWSRTTRMAVLASVSLLGVIGVAYLSARTVVQYDAWETPSYETPDPSIAPLPPRSDYRPRRTAPVHFPGPVANFAQAAPRSAFAEVLPRELTLPDRDGGGGDGGSGPTPDPSDPPVPPDGGNGGNGGGNSGGGDGGGGDGGSGGGSQGNGNGNGHAYGREKGKGNGEGKAALVSSRSRGD